MNNQPAGFNSGKTPQTEDQDTDVNETGHAHPIEASADADPALTDEAKDMIGQHLRRVYSDMVAEPLPDRFKDLLSQLSSMEPRS